MTRIAVDVTVDAPPATVWTVLTAFDAYPDWNPLVRRVDGRAEEGRRLRVVLTQRGVPPAVIAPRVTRVVPERELSWRSSLPVPGAFDATHQFLLDPLDDGERTRFTQVETFGGVGGAVVPRSLRDRLGDGFAEMNDALKRRAESTIPVRDGDG